MTASLLSFHDSWCDRTYLWFMLLVVGEGRREEGLLRIHCLKETGEALHIQLFHGSVNAYVDSSQHNGLIRTLHGAFYSLANSAVLLGGFAVTFGCCSCMGNYEY